MENAVITAVESVIAANIQAEETAKKKSKKPAAKKPAAKKPAAKAKAKPVVEPVAEPEAVKVVLYHGKDGTAYELALGADAIELASAVEMAGSALDLIQSKDSDLLNHYLMLGQFQSRVSKWFKAPKLYGQFLKSELPASQDIDVALRSNCKWLYEALNEAGADGSDLLSVLGINRIEDFKSANPTVIKREYKNALKELDKKAELEKAAADFGVDVAEAEKLLHDAKEKQAAADKASAKRKLDLLEKMIVNHLAEKDSIEFAADVAASIIRGMLECEAKDQFAFVESLVG